MVGRLLLRGMLVGIVAGLLCFGFLKLFGEPSVDSAIAFESRTEATKGQAEPAMSKAMPAMPAMSMDAPMDMADGPELVSRPVQAGLGLLTGVVVYGAAFGGLFALAFALAHGRMAECGPRPTAALLAAAGLIAVYVVPNLKYPASPPAVGDPATIGMRTGLYFAMVALSLAAMIGAFMLRRGLVARLGGWNAALTGGAAYLVAMAVASALLPAVNEVPDQFPAVVLWQFRTASMGAQLLLWATIGLLFGALTERAAVASRSAPGRDLRPGRSALS